MLDIALHVVIVAITIVVIFFAGVILLGLFGLIHAHVTGHVAALEPASLASPLLDMMKQFMKGTSPVSTTNPKTRNFLLFSWVFSAIAALLMLPLGRLELVENFLAQFQFFGVVGLLMIYPLGLLALCFHTSRKVSILNIKPLAEDLFSIFITLFLCFLSLTIYEAGGLAIHQFPSISHIIDVQVDNVLPIQHVPLASIFAIVNPLAALAFFSTLLSLFKPFEYSQEKLSKKWRPDMEFSGDAAALVKFVDILRFAAINILFVDLFLGGGAFTGLLVVDIPILAGLVFLVAVFLSITKARSAKWFMERKIIAFIKVHNLVAVGAVVLSLVLAWIL